MATTTCANGRLCNQIFRNFAVSQIAEKHDLFVNYINRELIEAIGIKLFCGNRVHPGAALALREDNYFSVLNGENLNQNLDPNGAYFQTKQISNMMCKYLHENKSNVIERNLFRKRYNANNDLFVHVRLTDATRYSPGIAYYLKVIQTIKFDNLFIATDEPSHPMILQIQSHYPDTSKIIQYDEMNTIHFGSTCKNVILSHGSFSAIIGYLSFFSTVYYPEVDPNNRWCGDMCSIDGWIEHPINF